MLVMQTSPKLQWTVTAGYQEWPELQCPANPGTASDAAQLLIAGVVHDRGVVTTNFPEPLQLDNSRPVSPSPTLRDSRIARGFTTPTASCSPSKSPLPTLRAPPTTAIMEKITETLKKATIGGDKKAKKDKKAAAPDAADAGPLEMQPPPAFLQERLDMFDRLYKEQQDEIAKRPHEDILITLGDGTIKPGKSYETTPASIAKGISNSLLKRTVIARIDGDQLWDLERPLEKSCKLELLDFNDDQGKFVFCTGSLAIGHCLGADIGLARALERTRPR